MERLQRRTWTGTLGVVLAGLLALSGCWDGPPAEPPAARPQRAGGSARSAPLDGPPPERAPERASEPAPVREPAPTPTPAEREDDGRAAAAEVLAQAPLAPSFHALALAFDVDASARVDVAVTGEATLFEVDLPASAVPLRRARALDGAGGAGLFGRGWRSELESRVVAVGEGALLVRVQGATPFVPLEGDVLVSLAGEVELLRRAPQGWELAAADGRVFVFDAQGRLASLTPGFSVERGPGRLTLTGDEGARVVLTLDDAGRAVRAHADGEAQALELRHDPATGELRAAGERRYEVDPQGRLLRAGALEVAYDAAGHVARLGDADGRAQTYGFGAGRAEVSTAQGRYVYEQVDDGFVVHTPRGEDRAWLDARGRLVAFQRAGEATQVFERDALEQPLQPDGVVGEAAGGDLDDEVARALGLRVTRDAAGRLREVLTAAGRRWAFGWAEGRLVSTDGPAGPVSLTHDARGRPASRRDASGRELFFELDAHGAPLSVATRTGEQVVWTRDDDGREQVIAAHDAAGGVSTLGLLRDEATGAVIAVELPGGEVLVYGQAPGHDEVLTPWGLFAARDDARGLPEELRTPAGVFRFAHDEQGRRVATEYPNGLVVERTRDAAGRVARQVARHAGRVVSQVESTRDERGRRASTTRDGVVTRYAHDARGRLTGLERPGSACAWSWNDDAERTGEVRDGAALELRYDARGRIASRAGGGRVERFVHDAAGRLLERVVEAEQGGHVEGRDRFEYDGFGRLVRVQRAGRSAVGYTYDPLGRLLTRTVDGETTRLVHDGERLLAEVGPGARERLYVWGPADDEPLAWCQREGRDAPWTWRFVVTSDLHTSLAHVDAQGRVAAQDELDPWGAGEAASDRPVFFAGHRVDAAAGLVPMRARWYDPSLGRFLTPDPAGLAAGPNAYVYVSGRPLDLVDPLGLQEAPREEPGVLSRFGRWVSDTAAGARDTVVGATEGLAYLTGLRGTASERAAARAASWDDLASGRAQSRALGATDAYVQGMTFGLVDPNYSRFAHDPEQARRGRAYGDTGALAFGLVSGRAALAGGLRAGVTGLVSGARALPGAVRALPAAVRALPAAARAAPGAAGRGLAAVGRGARAVPGRALEGLRAAPGLVRDGLGWAARSRGPLARAVGRAVGEQARGAYRVTVGPFVNLAKALLRPGQTLREAGRGLARMPAALRDALRTGRTAGRAGGRGAGAGAATLVDDVAGVARAADDLALAADDLTRAALVDDAARGAAAADEVAGQAGQVASRGPQDGIVQALGGGPPTAVRPAPRPGQGRTQTPRAPPERAPTGLERDGVPVAAADLDDVTRLTADDLAHVTLDDAARSASELAAARAARAPRPPATEAPTLHETRRLDFVEVGPGQVRAYDRERGTVVGTGFLDAEGALRLEVNVPAAGLQRGENYGTEAVLGIFDAMELSGREVNLIEGNWTAVGDYNDNFVALRDNLRAGMSVENAARATPTGKIARKLGFTEARPASRLVKDAAGRVVGVYFSFFAG